jgi:uncharacterized protein YbbC (DUF1343 family)
MRDPTCSRAATLLLPLFGLALPSDSMPLAAQPTPMVANGIDVLREQGFASLRGQKLGLVTNHTGRALDGTSTIRLLARAEGLSLVKLFSPEHGIAGRLDSKVADAKDEATGLPIHSLYGEHRKPTAAMLAGLDTLVYDIQDIGCRFYTYISTLGLVLEAASEQGLRCIVLDRPNPLGGERIEGPLRDERGESFTAWHRIPIVHGMTIGELARMFVAERNLKVELQVVAMRGWQRDQSFDATGQLWVDPSPNLRSLTEAFLYPGVGLLETTNLSVGRGTGTPFEVFGAPWLDARRVAAELNAAGLPGVRFVPCRFTPSASKHQGVECGGVNLIVTDRAAFQPVRTGIEIACALKALHGNDWQIDGYRRLLQHEATHALLREGRPAAEISKAWEKDVMAFAQRRRPFLLY